MGCWNVLRENYVFWLYWSSKAISLSESHAIARGIACVVGVQRGTRAGFSHSDLIWPCQSSFHQWSIIVCYNPCGVHRPDYKAPCHKWGSSLEIRFCPGTHLYRVQIIKHHNHISHDQRLKNKGRQVTTATEFCT